MASIEGRIEMPPAVSSLLSLPSSSQSVLLARDPPTDSENDPRVETSLLGPPLKKLLGLVSWVVPGVSVASWTKVASVQRQLGHLLRGDDLTQGWVRGLHRYFGRADFYGGLPTRGRG